jgi:hypothetical protein
MPSTICTSSIAPSMARSSASSASSSSTSPAPSRSGSRPSRCGSSRSGWDHREAARELAGKLGEFPSRGRRLR